jgi:DNA ligase-associated metallophosphoesterase
MDEARTTSFDATGAPGAAAPCGTSPAQRAACTVDLAGETVTLLAGRALHWPRESLLVIADPHFGKAATFRAHGIPVPGGTTADTLARLTALLARTGARRLLVLGDFLHHRTGRTTATFDALAAWRDRHRAVDVALVPGNHDAHAGAPPASLDIASHAGGLDAGPFRFAHEPARVRGRHVVAGHVHPAVVVSGRRESVRLACFLAGPDGTVLPAFGAFTGSCVVRPGPRDRVFVIADEAIFPVRT